MPTDLTAHFTRLYAHRADPWDLATSPYEREKYAASLAALGDTRFAQAVEIGCSIGTLTERLAAICDEVLGLDLVEAPLVAARQRCSHLPHVRLQRMSVPESWPDGRFDLIVLSEVLYFLSAPALRALATRIQASLCPSGRLLVVNWQGPNDGTMPGAQAAALLLAELPGSWQREAAARERDYHIDVVTRPAPPA